MGKELNGAWLALGVAGAAAAAGVAMGRGGSMARTIKEWAIVDKETGYLATEFDSDAATSSEAVDAWIRSVNGREHGLEARDFKAYDMDLYPDRRYRPWKDGSDEYMEY